jgi:hypothetical protein
VEAAARAVAATKDERSLMAVSFHIETKREGNEAAAGDGFLGAHRGRRGDVGPVSGSPEGWLTGLA